MLSLHQKLQVGCYWYTSVDNQLWKCSVPVEDAELDGRYLVHHTTATMISEMTQIKKLHYIHMYFGQVVYNCETQCYEVTCDEDLIDSEPFRTLIDIEFGLNSPGVEYELIPLYTSIDDPFSKTDLEKMSENYNIDFIKLIDDSEEKA